jgi:1,4-alpha-glucan branching enzyme
LLKTEDAPRLLAGEELFDPHAILGLHGEEIRLWRPGARKLSLKVKGEMVEAQSHGSGLFVYRSKEPLQPFDYQTFRIDGTLTHDPYAFMPTFGEMDEHLLGKGEHYELYRVMGARSTIHQGVAGTLFAVWAPMARRVSLVGNFNDWDPLMHPMRAMGASGVWELFLPSDGEGMRYKFAIRTGNGELLLKADPFAHMSEVRPGNASVVFDVNSYEWGDQDWKGQTGPMSIYEVHLGSWRRDSEGNWLTYEELARQLADYCTEMGFTHVELLPITEHPYDGSWGYQVSGYFAPTSRFGTPADFQKFVDILHKRGIGVFLDWVPGHFPQDEWSLGNFDGTCLYEHLDPRQGHHPHWTTKIFNFERREVANFLIASALYWLDVMHIDGLRVDAVSSMLLLNFGREDGDWLPNQHGGVENLAAIEFLKHLNEVVHERFPKAVVMAEESHAFPGVTHESGLGFDYKWDLGWMHDTLKLLQSDPSRRIEQMDLLKLAMGYHNEERYMLPLSHDEVVHLKKSLLSKMPGNQLQQYAQLRLLLCYMYCHPGPKLLFMGGEFGQWSEWNHDGELDWQLLDYPAHMEIQELVRELNFLYRDNPDLHSNDFEWIHFGDGWCSYRRGTLTCVHNFVPEYHDYRAEDILFSSEPNFDGRLAPYATLIHR